jgi:hypothetical protein
VYTWSYQSWKKESSPGMAGIKLGVLRRVM